MIVEQLVHALKMARQDILFLNDLTDLPNIYRWRTLGTVEHITKLLGDAENFEVNRRKWTEKGDYPREVEAAFRHLRSDREQREA